MKKDCVYMNRCYRHGSALELKGENLLCNDGEWEKGSQPAGKPQN